MNEHQSKGVDEVKETGRLLREPFPPDRIGWKPQTIKDGRCLAVAYIDARNVMDRLDAVVGSACWQDEYHVQADGSVMCRLSVCFDAIPGVTGERWITKTDFGDSQEKGGTKAAASDALKRAAVKFGIGRYLYDLPLTWVDYDAKKKIIPNPPSLPEWALPYKPPAAAKSHTKQKEAKPEKPVATGATEPVETKSEEQKAKEFLEKAKGRIENGPPPASGPERNDQIGWNEHWERVLGLIKSTAELNAAIPDVAKVPDKFKKEVWGLVTNFAASKGLEFDKETKMFVAPKKTK